MAIKVTTEKDGRIAVAFGKTVRHMSFGEAFSLGTSLIEAAWARAGMKLAAKVWEKPLRRRGRR